MSATVSSSAPLSTILCTGTRSVPTLGSAVEEANYRELVENASDIIYAHDLEGRFTWVNKAWERVTGFSREEALRMRIWDVIAADQVDRAREAIEKKLSG